MSKIKAAAAFVSAVLAAATVFALPSQTNSRYLSIPTAHSADVVQERTYNIYPGSTLTWMYSAEVSSITCSDTSVCKAQLSDASSVMITGITPGYADVTAFTSTGYTYILHITVMGAGITTVTTTAVTTAPVTTTVTASAVTTAASQTGSSIIPVSTTVQTVTTQPSVTATTPTSLISFSGSGDRFAQADKQSEQIVPTRSTYSANSSYSLFGSLDYVNEMVDSNGEIYAAVGTTDTATVIQKSTFHHTVMNFPGYTFAAATFGDDDHIYALWGKTLESATSVENNIVVTKFTKSGSYVAMYPLSSSLTESEIPFDAGNGRLAYNNGKLAVMFDTQWLSGHQGAELFRLDTATGEYEVSKTNVCSHSFGIDLIPTDTGFVSLQKGDCYDRGLMLQELPNSAKRYNEQMAWHISGIYCEPGEHQNATFTHMGGIAATSSTYAIAGKSERFYTSSDYASYKTGVYDGFVRIISRNGDSSGLSGVDRTDEQTGETVDSNVIWLTDSTGEYKTGNIKIAAINDDRYCVLWEALKDNTFDHVSYVILSDKGEILQPETVVTNARLSSTSIDPIAQGDVLTWAVADVRTNNLDWYTLDTSSSLLRGDVNTDGKISSADLVKLSKYILLNDTLTYTQASAADLTSDGSADTFDMILLRRKVIDILNS